MPRRLATHTSLQGFDLIDRVLLVIRYSSPVGGRRN
jgi:hypothetical protein